MDDWERLPEMDVIFAGAFAAPPPRLSDTTVGAVASVAWRARF